MADGGSLSDAWERHASRWQRWTRVQGHDVYFEHFNWPAFHALVPKAGRRTLDVGCGEGRGGRRLAADGHHLSGIDSSPTLLELAREAGGYEELVCGDAAKLPWDAHSFDLAVAFMCLQDIEDMPGAIDEIARVLDPGGRLCLAIVHPLNRAPERLENYFDEQRFADELERDGLRMTFEGIDRPFEAYTRALTRAGFLVEELREPRPSAADVAAAPELAKPAGRPYSSTCAACSHPENHDDPPKRAGPRASGSGQHARRSASRRSSRSATSASAASAARARTRRSRRSRGRCARARAPSATTPRRSAARAASPARRR